VHCPVSFCLTSIRGENGRRTCQDCRKEEGTRKETPGIGCEDQDGESISFIFVLPAFVLKRSMQLVQKENDLHYLLDLREGRGQDGKREWMACFTLLKALLYLQ
jgi:hypothetical protein